MHRREILGWTLSPWQARALLALTGAPMTAAALLDAAQYAKASSGLYPHQRRELLALSPALVTVTRGSRGPLYARTPLGECVALAAYPSPPPPPQRGGCW